MYSNSDNTRTYLLDGVPRVRMLIEMPLPVRGLLVMHGMDEKGCLTGYLVARLHQIRAEFNRKYPLGKWNDRHLHVSDGPDTQFIIVGPSYPDEKSRIRIAVSKQDGRLVGHLDRPVFPSEESLYVLNLLSDRLGVPLL